MTDDSSAPARRTGNRLRWRNLRWVLLAVVVIVLAPILWIGVRAYIAYDALLNAEADVSSVKTAITSNDLQALPYIYADMSADTASAAGVTSDPIWDAADHIPVVGPNLLAVHQVATTINSLVVDGVGPLAKRAKTLNIGLFRPVHGQVDMAEVEGLIPTVDSAYRGIEAASASADKIDTSRTLGPVTGAIVTLRSTLATAAKDVATAKQVVELLPPAFGSAGARDYLVVLGSNGEDRANGGAVVAAALVRVDNGSITLVRTATLSELGIADAPPSLASATLAATTAPKDESVPLAERQPDFPAFAADIAKAWTAKFGQPVDSVVSIDSMGLGYLASALDTVATPDRPGIAGTELGTYLDSQVYRGRLGAARISADQAAALSDVLSQVIAGKGVTSAYLTAAGHLFNEKRFIIWSAEPAEQKFIASTPLAGTFQADNSRVTTYGVFLNDATAGAGSAPSINLLATASLTAVGCTSPTSHTSTLRVTLQSSDKSGSITEDVTIYGPVDFTNGKYTLSGADVVGTGSGRIGHRPVRFFRIRIAPGATAHLVIEHHSGGPAASTTTAIRTTPRWQGTQLTFALCG